MEINVLLFPLFLPGIWPVRRIDIGWKIDIYVHVGILFAENNYIGHYYSML
jgi:hypothetical protein